MTSNRNWGLCLFAEVILIPFKYNFHSSFFFWRMCSHKFSVQQLKKKKKREPQWLIQCYSGFRPLSGSQSVKAPEGPVALQGVRDTPRSRCGCNDLLCRIKYRAHKPVLHFQFGQCVQRNITRSDFSRHALKKILFTYVETYIKCLH